MPTEVHHIWWVPAHVPSYDPSNFDPEEFVLVAFNDVKINAPDYYIPVFKTVEDCDTFVSNLAKEHGDLAFAVCAFETLTDIRERVKEDFNSSIDIVIKESNV